MPSAIRATIESTRPPTYPASDPRVTPATMDSVATLRPTIHTRRAPNRSRVNTSRPRESVPSR